MENPMRKRKYKTIILEENNEKEAIQRNINDFLFQSKLLSNNMYSNEVTEKLQRLLKKSNKSSTCDTISNSSKLIPHINKESVKEFKVLKRVTSREHEDFIKNENNKNLQSMKQSLTPNSKNNFKQLYHSPLSLSKYSNLNINDKNLLKSKKSSSDLSFGFHSFKENADDKLSAMDLIHKVYKEEDNNTQTNLLDLKEKFNYSPRISLEGGFNEIIDSKNKFSFKNISEGYDRNQIDSNIDVKEPICKQYKEDEICFNNEYYQEPKVMKYRRIIKKQKHVFDSLLEEEEVESVSINSGFFINVNSKFKKSWDAFIFMFILYSVFVNPYKIAFDKQDTLSNLYLDTIIDLLFCVDIFLSFVTSYYYNDEEIIHRSKIIKNYLRGWFIFDITSSIPFGILQIIYYESESRTKVERITRYFKLLKWMRVLRIFKLFKHKKNKVFKIMKKLNSAASRSIKLIFVLILVGHITGCIFVYMAKQSPNIIDSWIYKNNMMNSDDLDIFIASVYFSFTTIFTIGYGDITACSTQEYVYVLLLMAVGCAIFSYSLSSFSNALIENDQKTQLFNYKERILNEIDMEHKLPEDLYNRLKKTITYEYLKWNDDYISFISNLPSVIKSQLFIKIYNQQIQVLHFFEKKSYDFIVQVIPLLKSGKFYKDDVVIALGEIIEEMYLVYKGSLSIQLGKKYQDFEIGKIKEGFHFGDILMYSNEQSIYNIVVKSLMAETMILKKPDFAQIKLVFSNEVNDILRRSLDIYTLIERRRFIVYDHYTKYKTMENFKNKDFQEVDLKISQLEISRQSQEKILYISESLKKDDYIFEKLGDLKKEEKMCNIMNTRNSVLSEHIVEKQEKIPDFRTKRHETSTMVTYKGFLSPKKSERRRSSVKENTMSYKKGKKDPPDFINIIDDEIETESFNNFSNVKTDLANFREKDDETNIKNPFLNNPNIKIRKKFNNMVNLQSNYPATSENNKNLINENSNYIYIKNLNINYDEKTKDILDSNKYSQDDQIRKSIDIGRINQSYDNIELKKNSSDFNNNQQTLPSVEDVSSNLPRRHSQFLFQPNSLLFNNKSTPTNKSNLRVQSTIFGNKENSNSRNKGFFNLRQKTKFFVEKGNNDGFLDELNDQIKNEGFLHKNQEIVRDYLKDFLDLKGMENKNFKKQFDKLKTIENSFKKIIKKAEKK